VKRERLLNKLKSRFGSTIRPGRGGFTLIELSIVLVVIGLVVGGVLVGQDLIRAAYVRAQISQIEKYNTAVNTFYGKYQALPGDLNGSVASAFGFAARGSLSGQGDGNGLLEANGNGQLCGRSQASGETGLFWEDLTNANGMNLNLVEGSFSGISATTYPASGMPQQYFPPAKIGGGNYIYVYSYAGGCTICGNFFGLSAVAWIGGGGVLASSPGLTVKQAYDIDKKIDDGFPLSGRVTATYDDVGATNQFAYAAGGQFAAGPYGPSGTSATVGSASTCYDNSTSADGQTAADGNTQHYSMEMSGGNRANCALSFMFK
jgi:prepilin-type N-terminal cleavage/methylation domain-containing protein